MAVEAATSVPAAAALLAAGGVAARSQATTPGVVYVIKVRWTGHVERDRTRPVSLETYSSGFRARR